MTRSGLLKLSTILLLAATAGCARYRSTSKPVQIDQKEKNERVFETNEQAVKAGVYEEFVDSSALKRGEVIQARPETEEPPEVPPVPAAVPSDVQSPGRVPANVMMGYRIQLGAFSDMESAEELAHKARAVFGSRYPVYVRFYSPYWKVQAGDCAGRDEANRLREFMRRNGYPDAFVVQSGIQR